MSMTPDHSFKFFQLSSIKL